MPKNRSKEAPVHAGGPVMLNFRLTLSGKDVAVTWRDVFKVLAGVVAIAAAAVAALLS